MIVFRYTKEDGAQYLSHLDTLRHLNKIMRRAEIDTLFSKGYNPHMHIFMSSPIAVGIISESEYCLVDTETEADDFKRLFNQFACRGLNCLFAVKTAEKVSVAGLIDGAEYKITGINKFDVKDIMSSDEFVITDRRGVTKNARDKIRYMKFDGDALTARLGFGNVTLRADLFTDKLLSIYGGGNVLIKKTEAFYGNKPFDQYLSEISVKTVSL